METHPTRGPGILGSSSFPSANQWSGGLKFLLADDHEVARKGVRVLLESHPGWKVVGEASEGREAVEMAKALQPDVVIMDITMPGLTGMEAAKKILAEFPAIKILFFTMHSSEQMVHEAMAAGAHGYVLKSDAGSDLLAAIQGLGKQKTFISPKLAPLVADQRMKAHPNPNPAKTPSDVLTGREREVLQLLAEGKSSKEVASELKITLKTVETHRANLMAKLDLHSLASLVRYAIRNKLVQP